MLFHNYVLHLHKLSILLDGLKILAMKEYENFFFKGCLIFSLRVNFHAYEYLRLSILEVILNELIISMTLFLSASLVNCFLIITFSLTGLLRWENFTSILGLYFSHKISYEVAWFTVSSFRRTPICFSSEKHFKCEFKISDSLFHQRIIFLGLKSGSRRTWAPCASKAMVNHFQANFNIQSV